MVHNIYRICSTSVASCYQSSQPKKHLIGSELQLVNAGLIQLPVSFSSRSEKFLERNKHPGLNLAIQYVATWSLPMGASAVHGILCSSWYIVYCHIIHYCEYWSDTMKFVPIWCNNWCSKLLNLDKVSVQQWFSSLADQYLVSQVQRVATFKLIDDCTHAISSEVLGCSVHPNHALFQYNELTCMDKILIIIITF